MEPNQEAVLNDDVDEQQQSLDEASLDRGGNAPDTEDSGLDDDGVNDDVTAVQLVALTSAKFTFPSAEYRLV
ncbi:hypothetical protein RI367_008792 [Sorochytrium milnesiophthora]